jgi:hypothetical protein
VSVANATNETDGTAKGRAPWMPFWGTDFMAATLGWSASERGAYMILLWAAWEGDGLPSDPADQSAVEAAITAAWTTAMAESYAADGAAPSAPAARPSARRRRAGQGSRRAPTGRRAPDR